MKSFLLGAVIAGALGAALVVNERGTTIDESAWCLANPAVCAAEAPSLYQRIRRAYRGAQPEFVRLGLSCDQ